MTFFFKFFLFDYGTKFSLKAHFDLNFEPNSRQMNWAWKTLRRASLYLNQIKLEFKFDLIQIYLTNIISIS